jgi:putative redox protein
MKSPYKKISKTVDAELQWSDGLKFVSTTGSNNKLVLDASPEHGGNNQGARPMEAVLSALGSSTGMDLITILKNKKRKVEKLKIKLHAERASSHPHIFKNVTIEYIIWGFDIKDEDVKWALDLSLNKYCSVAGMLKNCCKLNFKWRIHKQGHDIK